MTLNIYLFTTLVTAIKKLLLLTTNVLISITGFVYKINKNPLFRNYIILLHLCYLI